MEGLTCNHWGYEFQKGVVEWVGREEDRQGVQRVSVEWKSRNVERECQRGVRHEVGRCRQGVDME